MNIQRHSLSLITTLFFSIAVLTLSACGGGDGGSEDADDSCDIYTFSDEQGIWTGTMRSVSGMPVDVYDVTMVFHLPDGADEGRVMGSAFKQGSLDPGDHFLFDSGYENARDYGYDFDVIVGTHGDHGSFLREYDYETGSQGDSTQRGKMELTVTDCILSGNVVFAEYEGTLVLEAIYSPENIRASTLDDLRSYGGDSVVPHLWSNDNTDSTGGINPLVTITGLDNGDYDVQQDSSCSGDGMIADISGYNMFLISDVDVSGCNYETPVLGVYPDVDGDDPKDVYDGLGILIDKQGALVFHTFISQKGVMLYNEWY